MRSAAYAMLASLCWISAGAQQGTEPPRQVSLDAAVALAEKNEPALAQAVAAHQAAKGNQYLAKASLLPSVVYHNQVLYTQPNGERNQAGQVGSQASPAFIANNAVREYASQAVVNETVGLRQFADAEIAAADVARTDAELEVTRRGVIAAVVTLYYGVAAARHKLELETQAVEQAQQFLGVTEKREGAREVAHADVVKAQLQLQNKQRDLLDAKAEAERTSLELGVLLFPDPRTPFATDASLSAPQLPTREEAEAIAAKNSPEVRSALAELAAANAEVKGAKAAYLPELGLNFTYGIDAPQFALRGPDAAHNLGYSLSATLDVPVWNWLSTEKRIQQSKALRDATRVQLTATQRRAVAEIEERYTEADTARQALLLSQSSMNTAREDLKLTNLRYGAGEATALEVVDAQNSLLVTELQQADGEVRFQTALAALQLMIGSFQ